MFKSIQTIIQSAIGISSICAVVTMYAGYVETMGSGSSTSVKPCMTQSATNLAIQYKNCFNAQYSSLNACKSNGQINNLNDAMAALKSCQTQSAAKCEAKYPGGESAYNTMLYCEARASDGPSIVQANVPMSDLK